MKRLLLAAVLSIAGLANAATVTGFTGSYAASNWTQSPGTGSINTTGAPNSISLTSGDDSSGNPSFTNFYIQFLVDSTVSFTWSYETTDDPFYDPFGYVLANSEAGLDGSFAQLTDDSGAASQSGAATVFVMANQYFGFSGWTADNMFGDATTTIRGLQIDDGSGTVPEPSSLLLLGVALAAAGAATRRRRTV